MNGETTNLTIRSMSRDEVDLAIDWAAAEGWNPGLTDAATFYAADPGSFLVGLLDGEPAACISAVKYGSDFGFLGFYIVRPELRGKGYGLQLWQAAVERLAGRNIGLDGVLEQQANYERSGFKLAYRNVRYAGVSSAAEPVLGIMPLDQVPVAQVLAYDARHFPAPRPAFLEAWLTAKGSTSLAVVKGGTLRGYGVIRPCRTGYKIGPLFADEPIDAERLYLSMLNAVPEGSPVYLDIPEVNLEAAWLADLYHMEPVFETVRMYTQATPDLALDRIYGVTSFELG